MEDKVTGMQAATAKTLSGFNLTRYFALLSLLFIVVAAGALGALYRQISIDSLRSMSEDRNAALARIVGSALWDRCLPLLQPGRLADPASPEVAALQQALVPLMRDTGAVKVKLYSLDGVTVFSSEAKQIGESKRDNPGFLAALRGELATKMTHRDRFSAFEGVIQDRHMVETYIPYRPAGSERIAGVFELYSDVTPFLAGVERTQLQVVSGVALVMSLLYLLLYLIVRRAKKVIRTQQQQLADTLALVEDANRSLDQRVNERTADLTDLNRALENEIAERARAEEEVRLTAKVFENTVEGVLITDAECRILRVNSAFTRVTGFSEEDVRLHTPAILKSGRHDEGFYAEMWKSLRETGQWVGEVWNRRKNGEVYPERLTIGAVCDDAGQAKYYVGVFSDISDVKRSQERLDYLAHHDQLTGLPNRLLLSLALEHSISLARRNGGRLAVLFIDLDHFKNVNDTLGHELGDELIRAVADVLRGHLRKSDTLARVGGDEFMLLLNDVETPRYAATVAEKFLALLNRSFVISGYELAVSASIGVSFFPSDGEDVSTLVKNADTAMYCAKSHGRNTYHMYASEMGAYARERVRLEALLRNAVERGELHLHYQSKVCLASGALVGAEALLRWDSPELGEVPPVRFIPVAEDIGLISELGEWVLRTACEQVKAWEAAGFILPGVAVNLSVRQLERGDIVETVSRVLRETGFSPERLELEVTESAIMNNDMALRHLNGLHMLGLELSVDDFGTGYSSLSYLLRMPVQKLKIDRSFITDVTSAPGRVAIVRAVIALANALRLEVVAEGVETEVEARFLKDEGCHQGQGYFFAKPLPAAEFQAAWAARAGTRAAAAGGCRSAA